MKDPGLRNKWTPALQCDRIWYHLCFWLLVDEGIRSQGLFKNHQGISKITEGLYFENFICQSVLLLLNSRLQRADAKQKNAWRGSSNGDSHESLSDEDSKECGPKQRTTVLSQKHHSWTKVSSKLQNQKLSQWRFCVKKIISFNRIPPSLIHVDLTEITCITEGLLLDSRRWILLSWFKKSPIEGLFVRQNLAGMFHRIFVSTNQKETPTDFRWRIKNKHVKSCHVFFFAISLKCRDLFGL